MTRYVFLERFYAVSIVLFAVLIILAHVGRDAVPSVEATFMILLTWVSGILVGIGVEKNTNEAKQAAIDAWFAAEKQGDTMGARVREWLEEHEPMEDTNDPH